MNEKNLRDVLIAFGKAVRSACHEAAMVRQSISGAKWDRFTAGKCAEAVSMVNTDAIADRYASQFIGIVALETERLTFDPESRDPGNVAVVYDDGRDVPVRLTLGSEGVECAGYASQIKQRGRTHTESQLTEVRRVRESHQKFVEETGIDYAALASSGFDANSGEQVQPEPVNQQMLAAPKEWARFEPDLLLLCLKEHSAFDVELIGAMLKFAIAAAEAAQHNEDKEQENGTF